MSNILTVKELMAHFKIQSSNTVYVYIKQGMPSLWAAGRRFELEPVLRWLKRHKKPSSRIDLSKNRLQEREAVGNVK